jgi:hypothetical protein
LFVVPFIEHLVSSIFNIHWSSPSRGSSPPFDLAQSSIAAFLCCRNHSVDAIKYLGVEQQGLLADFRAGFGHGFSLALKLRLRWRWKFWLVPSHS